MDKILKPLTWKQLADKINKMSEEEKNQPVQTWSEDTPLHRDCFLMRADEDLYACDEFDAVFTKDELDDEQIEDCFIVVKKNTPYLWHE